MTQHPLKILHVIAGAKEGGAETFFADTVQALAERGVEQYAIARPHPVFLEAFAKAGVRHETAAFSPWLRWWMGGRIRAAVLREKPSLIHAWMARGASFVPMGLSVPVLGWFGGPYNLKYYKAATHYAGVTRDLQAYLAQKTGASERCFCLHTFGTLAPPTRPLSRAEFGVPPDAPILLALSRMHWKKGIDTALYALQDVPGAHILLAGDGPNRAEYQALAYKLGVSERAHFLGWRTDRAALLALCDMCLLPSRYEPFGTVMAEAWGAGVPLIATRADGPRQYIIHEKNGLLVDIEDAKGLAHNITRVVNRSDVRQNLITHGLEIYNALFSRDVAIDALIAAYHTIREGTKSTQWKQ